MKASFRKCQACGGLVRVFGGQDVPDADIFGRSTLEKGRVRARCLVGCKRKEAESATRSDVSTPQLGKWSAARDVRCRAPRHRDMQRWGSASNHGQWDMPVKPAEIRRRYAPIRSTSLATGCRPPNRQKTSPDAALLMLHPACPSVHLTLGPTLLWVS